MWIMLSAHCNPHPNMSAEIKKEIQLEIAHVLFVDVVGYPKLSINEQRAAIDELARPSNFKAPRPRPD